MKLCDFISVMNAIAPPELAFSFDNVGLLIGPDHDEIRRVLVALDLNMDTAREAVETNADLVLTHHPEWLGGIKRFLPDHPDTAAPYILVRHGIGHFAAHTNLDIADGGVNDTICDLFKLSNVQKIAPDNLLRVGVLPDGGMTLREFADLAAAIFGDNVRFSGDENKRVLRVAVCGGSGNNLEDQLKICGVDAYFTGEVKHSTALALSVLGVGLVTAGHYETEHPVLNPLISRLQRMTDDVQYNLARSESSPFRCR